MKSYFVCCSLLLGLLLLSIACPVVNSEPKDSAEAVSGFMLWQLPSQIKSIGMSYICRTSEGRVIVVDGGYGQDASYLREFLGLLGNKVDTWFISHPHEDHAGALVEILKNPKDIKIRRIVHSSLDKSWYKKYEPECQAFCDDYYKTLSNSDVKKVEAKIGMTIKIDGMLVEVLGIKNPEFENNPYNNQSMVLKVSDTRKSVLFLGDLGVDGGRKLLAGPMASKVRADYVQMSHHGQRGVDEAFYQAVSPKYCLWPIPKWLWDNDSGKGPNSGSWDTMLTREWISKLNVKENYLAFQGLVLIQ